MKKSTHALLLVCFIFGLQNIVTAQFKPLDTQQFNIAFEEGDRPPPTTTGSSQPTSSGGGDGIVDLELDLPSYGYIIPQTLLVAWSHESLRPPYHISVAVENGDEVFSAELNTTEYQLDLKSLNLDPDEHYYILIQKQKGEDLHSSKRAAFDVSTQEQLDNLLSELEASDAYKNADAFKKEIMKAYLLSQNKFYIEAAKTYIAASKNANDAKNTVKAINMLNAMKINHY